MTTTPDEKHADTAGAAPGPRLRASDADRAATVEVLQDAVARGLLTHEEGGERIAAAFSARFHDELPVLTADLPPPHPPAPVGWRQLGSHLVTQVRHEVRTTRAEGLRSRRLLVAVLVAVLLVGLLGTVGGLAVHGLFDGGYEHHFDFEPQ